MIIKHLNIDENTDNIINETLLTHIAIDYILKSHQHMLFEKYGAFDGCEDIVEFLIKKCQKKITAKNTIFIINSKYKDFINAKINNVFFNEIELKINIKENSTSNGGYEINNSKINDDGLLEKVVIEYDLNKQSWKEDLRSLLYHELCHAYDDYNSLLQNKGGLNVLHQNDNYANYLIGRQSTNDIIQIISDILYHIDDTEKNAYIAQLKSELINHKEKIHGPREAFNIIRQSVEYQNVMIAKEIIYALKNKKYNENVESEIYNTYRKLNKEATKWTNNKIQKKLIYKIDKYINKMNKMIPKMCLDFLNNNTTEIREENILSLMNIKSLKDYIKDN